MSFLSCFSPSGIHVIIAYHFNNINGIYFVLIAEEKRTLLIVLTNVLPISGNRMEYTVRCFNKRFAIRAVDNGK